MNYPLMDLQTVRRQPRCVACDGLICIGDTHYSDGRGYSVCKSCFENYINDKVCNDLDWVAEQIGYEVKEYKQEDAE